jgi:hypothetical protein
MVTQLVKNYTGSWRSYIADNFFISIPLADTLWGLKTYLIGPLRKNKAEIPQQLLPEKKRKFTRLYMHLIHTRH